VKKYLSIILTVLVLMSLCGCQESQSDVTLPELLEPVSANLDFAEVKRDTLSKISYYKGDVVPYVQSLYFEATGKVANVYVKEGELVKEGQLLAKLDETTLQAKIDAKQAQIDHEEKLAKFSDDIAMTDIQIAKTELAILKESGASAQAQEVKKIEILQLETVLKQTKELRKLDMDVLYEELEALKAQKFNPELKAPFAGRIVYIAARVGGSVAANKPMFVLADDSRTYISCSALSLATLNRALDSYARVLGQDVEITYVPWENDQYLAEMCHEGDRTLFSWVADEPLRAGDFASILLTTERKENVLCVPRNALYRDADGYYVYKKDGDTLTRCTITTGLLTDSAVEILSGLEEGDVVHVKG